MNDVILKNLGYSYNEIINKTFKDFINKEDLLNALNVISEFKKTGSFPTANIFPPSVTFLCAHVWFP